MSIPFEELNKRLKEFRTTYRIRGNEIPLSFVSDMYWALGLTPRFIIEPKPKMRVMTAEDIGLPNPPETGR